jgi:L-asparaginase
MKIELITTGGTIDGADSDKGEIRKSSDVAKWLSDQPDIEFVHTPLFNKDSRLLSEEDRTKIAWAALNSPLDCVLVTHGTFTICKTGKAIKSIERQRILTKTILLVGSWIPFGERNSDAPVQMEFALRSFKTRPVGIYIAMDNRLWNPDATEKVELAPGVYKLRTETL